MKMLYKRIISSVFAFVILFFTCMPRVYALVLPGLDDAVSGVVHFFDWVGSTVNQDINFFWRFIDDDVCPQSSSLGGRHNFVEKRTQVDGKAGLYYVCDYCGKSAGEVGRQAYSDYTASLPAPVYNSDGSISWKIVPYVGYTYREDKFSGRRYEDYVCAVGTDDFIYNCNVFFILHENFIAPIHGTYSFSIVTLNSYLAEARLRDYDKDVFLFAGDIVVNASDSNSSYSKCVFYVDPESTTETCYWFGYFLISCLPLTYSFGDTYDTTTRPTTITGGNYGIVGDDGQITTVTNNSSIINETNNIYYNPATGNTGTINSWTYDYTDRSYHVTLESGDTITVTYGDEYITIVEGDVIYNIYYIINGDGSNGDNTDTPSHTHNWQETSRTEPTCTASGQILYTCSECGQTQVEVLKAIGHIWQVERTVQTSYDEDGNLIQQGYTIYQCSVCGEQYKDVQGTGPPGSSGDDDDGESIWDKIGNFFGTIFGGILDMIGAVIGKLLDALIFLAEMLMSKLFAVVEVVLSIFEEIPKLFGGFLAFLSAMFPFLPDEIMLLLTFGIAAVVFVGIIKAIRR